MDEKNERIRRMTANLSVVAGATLSSRVLGYVRDVLFAVMLGTTPFADAFFVAFRIPNLLRRLFGEGALSMAFVPLFSKIKMKQGNAAAFAFARSTFFWLCVLLCTLIALGLLFARPITYALAPGFSSNPELFDFTVMLVRVCLPYALLICSLALCMGILNSLDHFLAPALAPCVLNVVLISSGLVAWMMDANVPLVLAWSVLVAGILQWGLQQPFLRSFEFSWKGEWSPGHQEVRRLGWIMLPTMLGAAVFQMTILLGTLLASFLPSGSISYLYYADRLVQLPLGVFGVAVSTVALPNLSALASAGETKQFSHLLRDAVRLTLFITLPAAAGLLALSTPIVDLLFGYGEFAQNKTAVLFTARALMAYCVGLPAVALVRPLVSAFYAHQDTRTPVMTAVLSLLLYLGFALLLMPPLKHVGLALATSLAAWANAGFLAFFASRGLGPGISLKRAFKISSRYIILSCLMGLCAWCVWYASPQAWKNASVLLIPAWAVGYVYVARVVGIEEAKVIMEIFFKRKK